MCHSGTEKCTLLDLSPQQKNRLPIQGYGVATRLNNCVALYPVNILKSYIVIERIHYGKPRWRGNGIACPNW